MKHEHKRGKIKDSALAALVTSPTFKAKVFAKKKGKGSYSRKTKHKSYNHHQNGGFLLHFFEKIPKINILFS